MAITWTIIVLGTLLHGMQCNADDSSTTVPGSTQPTLVDPTSAVSIKPTHPPNTLSSITITVPSAPLDTTKAANTPAATLSSQDSITPTAQTTTKATSPAQTVPSSTSAHQNPATSPPTQNVTIATQITAIPPTTPSASTATTASNDSPQNTSTPVTASDPKQVTTNLNKLTTTITTEGGTTQLSSTQSSAVDKNSTVPNTAAPDSKSTDSQSVGTTKAQTTTTLIIPGWRNEDITTSTSTPQEIFNHSFDLSSSTEVSIIHEACKTLGQKVKGNCMVNVENQDKRFIVTVTIDANQKIKPENDKPQGPDSGVTDTTTLQKEDTKDTIPDTLIAILASCGALVLILCCFAAYCTYHRRSYRKNQQHLTEELQTVENGYHDNPTLEVMEVQPEMQEKKLTLNGEFNDSWIVPIDNLLKEDIADEEDTHL